MKKSKIISVILVLFMCIMLFPACLFSDSATTKQCYELYDSIIDKYKDENTVDVLEVKETETVQGFNLLTFTYSETYGLNYDIQTGTNSILVNELQTLLNNSLFYFANYKNYLQQSVVYEKIPQEKISAIYTALKDFDKKIEQYMFSKRTLERLYDQQSKTEDLIAQKFENCFKDYFSLIKSALKISEATEKAVLSVVSFDVEVYSQMNAKNVVLGTVLQTTKLVANYYDQYIEFNGASQISSNLKLLKAYNNVNASLLPVILIKGTIFTDATIDNTIMANSISYYEELSLLASQMQEINNELKETIIAENAKQYYYNEMYNVILDKEVIDNCTTEVLKIYIGM